MKRYIVSEDELDNLIDMARDYGQNNGLKPVDAVCLSQARSDCTRLEYDENIGGKIINQMIEDLLGEKARFGEKMIEEGTVFSVTLSNLRKYDGWDIRVSIGPPGAFDEKDES